MPFFYYSFLKVYSETMEFLKSCQYAEDKTEYERDNILTYHSELFKGIDIEQYSGGQLLVIERYLRLRTKYGMPLRFILQPQLKFEELFEICELVKMKYGFHVLPLNQIHNFFTFGKLKKQMDQEIEKEISLRILTKA